MRRKALPALLAVLLVSSGCLGFVTGEQSLEFEADPARTDESVASNAGYESNGTQSVRVERNLSVADVTRRVAVTNEVTTYEKSVEVPVVGSLRLGVFSIISSPAVEVAGRELNPIGDYDNDQLVGLVQSRYDGLSEVRRVSNRTISVLGSDTTVSKYAASTTVRGQQVDVFVHVMKVRHGEDFVVAVGVYPQRLDGEEENVLEMMRAIDHPA